MCFASNNREIVGYDTSVIGGTMALDSFRRDFSLEGASDYQQDTLEGNIVSTFQAGTFFGALLTFPIAEIFGRKKAILSAIIIFLAGGCLMVRHVNYFSTEI
jgi:MFS family permease